LEEVVMSKHFEILEFDDDLAAVWQAFDRADTEYGLIGDSRGNGRLAAAQKALLAAREQVGRLRARLVETRAEKDVALAHDQQDKGQLLAERQRVATLQTALNDSQKQIGENSAAIRLRDDKIEMLQNQIDTLQDQLSDAQQTAQSLQAQLDDARRHITKNNARISGLEEEVERQARHLRGELGTIKGLEHKLGKADATIQEVQVAAAKSEGRWQRVVIGVMAAAILALIVFIAVHG
jgi:chromosome segregation ATPase